MNNKPAPQKQQSSAQVISTLALTFILTAAAVAIVNSYTEPIIQKHKAEQEQAQAGSAAILAIAKVMFPTAENTVAQCTWTCHDQICAINEISAGGATIGYLVECSAKGYQSNIRVQVGIDTKAIVQGIEVLSQAETPGLGDQVMTPEFKAQFKDKDLDHLKVTTNGAAGLINAITGATISSRACTEDAVKGALEHCKKSLLNM